MDGLIFDVDGTLWDSTDVVAKAWNEAIASHPELNLTITGSLLKNLFGKTMDEIYAALFPQLPKEEQVRMGELCYQYEDELLETESGDFYPGVIETLKELSKTTDLYIVSNCQCGYIEAMLRFGGLDPYIKDHLCFGETLAPKSGTIRALMERNGLSDVYYVGDTIGDAQACKDADVPFIFASYGFGDVPDARYTIRDIRELLGWKP